MDEDGLISQQQASELLGVTRQRVHQLIEEGLLTPVPLAGRRLLMAAQVRSLKVKRATPGPVPS